MTKVILVTVIVAIMATGLTMDFVHDVRKDGKNILLPPVSLAAATVLAVVTITIIVGAMI